MESYIVLCDIDGVLAWIDHRLHYMREKDYENFYSPANMSGDLAISSGRKLLDVLQNGEGNFKTILVTGRPERTREVTQNWLDSKLIPYDEILMRKDHDYRPSSVIKKEMVANILRQYEKYEMYYYFIDDDPTNVAAVEAMSMYITGLTYGTNQFNKLEEKNG